MDLESLPSHLVNSFVEAFGAEGQAERPHGRGRVGGPRRKTTKAERLARKKEENKRSQQRFRDRQKAEKEAREGQIAKLTARLQEMEVAQGHLAERNRLLETCLMINSPGSEQALAQSGALQAAPGRSLAQPGASKKQRYFHYFEWDDNTVFELSPLREEERFQTASQIKQMGLLEHQNVWKAYTLEFSRLVREANGSANSLAGQKAEGLIDQFGRWLSVTAVAKPMFLRKLFHSIMEPGRNEPNRGLTRQQVHDILAALRLTPQQRAQLLQSRADMFAKLNKLLQERRMLMWHMQSAAVRTDGSAYSVYVATEELMTNVEVVERLKKNNEAEHAAIDLYQATFFRSIMTGLQAATGIVASYPAFVPLVTLGNMVAEQERAPSAGKALPSGGIMSQVLMGMQTTPALAPAPGTDGLQNPPALSQHLAMGSGIGRAMSPGLPAGFVGSGAMSLHQPGGLLPDEGSFGFPAASAEAATANLLHAGLPNSSMPPSSMWQGMPDCQQWLPEAVMW
eukprot:jgi/Astpho2/7583/fgenesh1_pg.00115_%23_24_t